MGIPAALTVAMRPMRWISSERPVDLQATAYLCCDFSASYRFGRRCDYWMYGCGLCVCDYRDDFSPFGGVYLLGGCIVYSIPVGGFLLYGFLPGGFCLTGVFYLPGCSYLPDVPYLRGRSYLLDVFYLSGCFYLPSGTYLPGGFYLLSVLYLRMAPTFPTDFTFSINSTFPAAFIPPIYSTAQVDFTL